MVLQCAMRDEETTYNVTHYRAELAERRVLPAVPQGCDMTSDPIAPQSYSKPSNNIIDF